MDVSEAKVTVLPGVSKHAPRIVRFEDASSVVIEVGTTLIEGTPRPTHLTIRPADDAEIPEPITAVQLRELPLRLLVSRAAALLHEEQQEEWMMRALAQPRPHGQASWPPDHYERVLTVYEWARQTGRKGGGRSTVAEFWGVSVKAVDAWLARARKNQDEQKPLD